MKTSTRLVLIAVVVLADTETREGLGRVVNALTTAKEFRAAGDEAAVVFDGAGTRWVAELGAAEHRYHGLFEEVRDSIAGACSYCASAFGVRQAVEEAAIPLLEDFDRHPSLRTYVVDGYAVVTF